MPASSITRAEASISSSGSIVSCMTPIRNGTVIAVSALELVTCHGRLHMRKRPSAHRQARVRLPRRTRRRLAPWRHVPAVVTRHPHRSGSARSAVPSRPRTPRRTSSAGLSRSCSATWPARPRSASRSTRSGCGRCSRSYFERMKSDRRASWRQRGEVHRRRRDGRVRRACRARGRRAACGPRRCRDARRPPRAWGSRAASA